MRRAWVFVLLFAVALPAAAADRDFDAVVKGIETHYGIRRSHPHLLGFFLFLGKPAMWGSGAHGLKLAVFEDVNVTASVADLDRIVAQAVGPKWQPFVRVNSREAGESSVIYASFAGKQMRMLIASVEHGEIALVHIKVDGKGLRQWMDDPADKAKRKDHQGH